MHGLRVIIDHYWFNGGPALGLWVESACIVLNVTIDHYWFNGGQHWALIDQLWVIVVSSGPLLAV